MTLRESTRAAEVFSAAARTATATSGGVDTWGQNGRAREALFLLSVGEVSGDLPTLDVRIQHAHNDVAGEYVDVAAGAFTQRTSAGFEEIGVKNFRRFVRVIAAVGGTTPSFTFSVAAIFGEPLDAPI